MSWTFSSKRNKGGQHNPPYVEFCIGAVKIAEIVMDKRAIRWHFYLRLMRNEVSYYIPKERYETFSTALTALHEMLNSPPPDGFEV